MLYSLSFLHLVTHWTLHRTIGLHDVDIRTYNDYVVVAQPDVAGHTAIKNVVIDIDCRDFAPLSKYLDITKSTNFANTSCRIKCMEDSSKCR